MSLHPDVAAAMAAVAQRGGNPASQHRLGQKVRRAVDRAARALAALAGLPAGEVTFAADAAEACVLACAHLPAGARVWLWPPPGPDDALGRAAQVWAAWDLVVTAPPADLAARLPAAGADLDAGADAALAPAALVLLLARLGPDGTPAPRDRAVLAWAAAAGVAVHVDASAALAACAQTQAEGAAACRLTWPLGATPRSVVVDGPPIGGPAGVAALCVATSPAPRRPGTVPRELAVGLGAAALRLANGG